ncbi:MAG: hypothetical protein ACLFTR_00710 [Candidatus Woesearchaeota archaeon]
MKIIGRELDDEVLDGFLASIKDKKEFSGIDNKLIVHQIEKELSSDSALLDKIIAGKKTPKKELVKRVRAELHRINGSFNVDFEHRKKLMHDYLGTKDRGHIISLLETHSSTKERLPIYENLYANLFDITGVPASILDLGCGLNPLSSIFMEHDGLDYLACDISEDILELLDMFFDVQEKTEGETRKLNLFESSKRYIFKDIEQFDICFLFKVLDVIEQSKSHKISEDIIASVPADWVIVSFSKKTVSGKKMNHPYRGWLDKMLHRLMYMSKIIEYEDEIFYIIKKKQERKDEEDEETE